MVVFFNNTWVEAEQRHEHAVALVLYIGDWITRVGLYIHSKILVHSILNRRYGPLTQHGRFGQYHSRSWKN